MRLNFKIKESEWYRKKTSFRVKLYANLSLGRNQQGIMFYVLV